MGIDLLQDCRDVFLIDPNSALPRNNKERANQDGRKKIANIR